METNVNIKKIALIAGGFLILLVIFLLIFTRRTGEEQKPARQITSQIQREEKPVVPASKEDTDKSNVLVLTSSFAERFGSFSNQSDFQNIRDLFPFMTESMKNWAENYIEAQRAGMNVEIYYGITTKAISRKFLDFSENSAKVLVSTQRRESTGAMTNERIVYQDMELELVKAGEEWKVDGAKWK